MKTVNLKLIDGVPLPAVETDFSADDCYVTCALKYNEKPKESTLSDCISAQFNIQEIEPSINLGYASKRLTINFSEVLKLRDET